MKGYPFTKIILLITLLFLNSSVQAQTTVSIRLNTHTGQSAYIADNYLNTNWPDHPDLIAISWTVPFPASARTLFQIYLNSIPANVHIVNARLSLFANPTPVNTSHYGLNETYLRRVTSQWDKNTVLWEPQPDFTHHNEVLLPAVVLNQDLLNIDVTNLIRDMVNNPHSGFGFILMQRFEYPQKSTNFASGVCSDTTKRPLLEITYDNPLPVELSSFTSAIIGRNVTLKFTTTTEENNSGFEILRSSLNISSDFTKIGFVNASGTSKTPTNYTYEDRNLNSGRYKYKLKQIDYNGNFKHYELSNEVIVGVPEKFSLSQNYPNPFNPTTKINFDIPQDGIVTLKIYDVNGKEVGKLVNEFRNAGYYSSDFTANNLASGAYFYKLTFGDYEATKNMILIK